MKTILNKEFTFEKSPSMQFCKTFLITSMFGTSQTLKTYSLLIAPNPVNVACKLLIACRMSPSAVKIIASKPPSS